jgi:hypothetical protein
MIDYIIVFQLVMASLACLLAISLIIVQWRFRGLLQWRKSLSQELKILKKEISTMTPVEKKAYTIVLETCESIQRSFIVELTVFNDLPDYLRRIAACFYPDREHPEQCITIGDCLFIVQDLAFRLDKLLQQRGLNKFRYMRIRHIHQIYNRLKRLQKNPFMSLYLKYRKLIQKISLIRLIVFPDPFSWIFYLSNQFTVITVARYLLLEIYLYTGLLAVNAYRQTDKKKQISFSQQELEVLMQDLEKLQAIDSSMQSQFPELKKIRKKNLGFGRGLLSNLSLNQWKMAIVESAHIISAAHFPDADTPLMEASVGPILERSRYWLKTVNTIQSIPVVHKMADVKVETILQAKLMIDNMPEKFKQAVSASMKVYKLTKWPITIYRLARKATPIGMATSIGWIVTRNCIIFYIYHYSFYTACNEIDSVYKYSVNRPLSKHLN